MKNQKDKWIDTINLYLMNTMTMIARLKPKKRIKMKLMKMVLMYISSIRALKNLMKLMTMISLVKAIKTSLIIIYKRRRHRMLGTIMEMRWAMTMMMRNNLLT